jgi:hypothetical protein
MIVVCDTIYSMIETYREKYKKEPGIIIVSTKHREKIKGELVAALDGDVESVTQGMASDHFAIYNTYTVISPRTDFDIEIY